MFKVVPFRTPLKFPGTSPGFDPSHPMSRNIQIMPLVYPGSGASAGATVIDCVTGQAATKKGNGGASGFDSSIGPFSKGPDAANYMQYLQSAFPNLNPRGSAP